MFGKRIVNLIKWINNVIDFEMSLKGNLIIFSIWIRVKPDILTIVLIMENISLMNLNWLKGAIIINNNIRIRLVAGILINFITENINLMNLNIRRTGVCL